MITTGILIRSLVVVLVAVVSAVIDILVDPILSRTALHLSVRICSSGYHCDKKIVVCTSFSTKRLVY